MIIVKWFTRIGIAIFMLSILQGNGVGIVNSILWFLLSSFIYLFFIEYLYLSFGAELKNPIWWIAAHNTYVENKYDIPYVKWMWVSFVVMLQEDYED